jgi:tripartite-type tricarboxylate transporter receptor subunit TctC
MSANRQDVAAERPRFDVPTTVELGYNNSDYTFWNRLFVPRRHAKSSTG